MGEAAAAAMPRSAGDPLNPAPAPAPGPAYPVVPYKYTYPQAEERKALFYRGKRSANADHDNGFGMAKRSAASPDAVYPKATAQTFRGLP